MTAITTDTMLAEEHNCLADQQDARRRIHGDPGPVGLALSGGGIRSATFGLGFLQGLSRLGLLTAFDYLSTVSGGGYIGCWLSAWMHRHPQGAAGVMEELASGRRPCSLDVTTHDPSAIHHLRCYSNYLAPRTGLLSPDTWALAGTFVRNLVVNWLTLVPYFALVLMIPIFATDLLEEMSSGVPGRLGDLARAIYHPLCVRWVGIVSLALLAYSIGMLSTGLPGSRWGSVRPQPSTTPAATPGARTTDDTSGAGMSEQRFIAAVLIPLTASAIGLAAYWFLASTAMRKTIHIPAWRTLVVAGILVHLLGFVVYALLVWRSPLTRGSLRLARTYPKLLLDLFGVVASGALGGWLVWILGAKALPAFATALGSLTSLDSYHLYFPSFVVLAVPLLLGGFLLAMTLYVAIASRCMSDDDREWYARAGSWVQVVSLGWLGLSGLALFGPLVIVSPREGWFAGATSVVSGAITWWLGRSARTSGLPAKGKSSSSGREAGLLVAAAVFCIAFLVLVATAVTALRDLLVDTYGWSATTSLAAVAAGLILVIVVMMATVDVNVFSLHAMYRDRLVRAYLGASRSRRRWNRFTGFDPQDDLPLAYLAKPYFGVKDWPSVHALAERLSKRSERKEVDLIDEELISDTVGVADVDAPAVESLVARWNDVLSHGNTPAEIRARWDRMLDPPSAVALDGGETPPPAVGEPAPSSPLHIINTALNLVTGEEMAWQERKAALFSFTALHAGSAATGFRRVGVGPAHMGPTLGTAMAVSGAAANPEMGYHSSPLVTFLLTLLNGRLGVWIGNPADDRTCGHSHPQGFRIFPMALLEAFGQTTSHGKYVNLSDGGHVENLGLYELVRRRCQCIIAIDSGADERYAFEDLGNALRKIRVDLGIEVTLTGFRLGRENQSKYLAIGEIAYPDGQSGSLLYVKPVVCDRDEPVDVRQYRGSHPAYPHESTVDQWFSESQFESYRALGEHIALTIAGCPSPGRGVLTAGAPAHRLKNVEMLLDRAKEYVAAKP